MTRSFKKRLFLLALVALFALPTVTNAAKIDSRCFEEEDCIQRRMEMSSGNRAEAEEGFYRGPDAIAACGDVRQKAGNPEGVKMGFCLPVGKTTTGITFGTRTEFLDIGDFIAFMYRYGVAILGVVAVLVIIVSGIQWTISGGNSAAIDSAKKRISRAVIGLVIGLLSYVILATINPQLVSLRLPQVWLINTIQPPTAYCTQLTTSSFTAYFGPEDFEASEDYKEAQYARANFTTPAKQSKCGDEFFFEGGGTETCLGLHCRHSGQICVKDQKSQPRRCLTGTATGRITATPSLLCNDLDKAVISDRIWLMAACKNGVTEKVSETAPKTDPEDRSQFFFFDGTARNKAASACSDEGGVMGYYFVTEINDEGIAKGLLCSTPLGFGEDDLFAIGKNPSNPHSCAINLSPQLVELAIGSKPKCTNNGEDENCLCAGAARSLEIGGERFAARKDVQQFFFTPKDIQDGVVCDIHINRAQFPRQDNDVIFSACTGFLSKIDDGAKVLMTIQYSIANP